MGWNSVGSLLPTFSVWNPSFPPLSYERSSLSVEEVAPSYSLVSEVLKSGPCPENLNYGIRTKYFPY